MTDLRTSTILLLLLSHLTACFAALPFNGLSNPNKVVDVGETGPRINASVQVDGTDSCGTTMLRTVGEIVSRRDNIKCFVDSNARCWGVKHVSTVPTSMERWADEKMHADDTVCMKHPMTVVIDISYNEIHGRMLSMKKQITSYSIV